MLEMNDAGIKNRWIEREEKLCVVCVRWWFKESDEMRVLRGVVYKINSRGPRTNLEGHHIYRYDRKRSYYYI